MSVPWVDACPFASQSVYNLKVGSTTLTAVVIYTTEEYRADHIL